MKEGGLDHSKETQLKKIIKREDTAFATILHSSIGLAISYVITLTVPKKRKKAVQNAERENNEKGYERTIHLLSAIAWPSAHISLSPTP